MRVPLTAMERSFGNNLSLFTRRDQERTSLSSIVYVPVVAAHSKHSFDDELPIFVLVLPVQCVRASIKAMRDKIIPFIVFL